MTLYKFSSLLTNDGSYYIIDISNLNNNNNVSKYVLNFNMKKYILIILFLKIIKKKT